VLQTIARAALLIACFLLTVAQAQTQSAALRQIADAGSLDALRWPDFRDYRVHVTKFYEPAGYTPAWLRGGSPTPQAQSVIRILQKADQKGLHSEDYDGPRWDPRLARLSAAPETERARFDVALTVCVMRYISDLHIGRVNPQHFTFGLDVDQKKYNLPEFVRQRLLTASDPKAVLDGVEPPFAGYRRTQAALMRYFELARQDDGEQLPVPAKTVAPGAPYPSVPRLVRLLRLLGDLPADAVPSADPQIYAGPVVDAVKRYQLRHGLQADGRLGAKTVQSLNTPLAVRVRQLQLTLERWRWLPHNFPEPPVVVNIPEFRLRAFDPDNRPVLEMNVIVGKAFGHNTPVFADSMEYVVLRPYWNVTPTIQRSEIVPAIRKDRNYIANKGFEVTTQAGQIVTDGPINDDLLEQLRTGKLAVRQKPGPANSLGLVKLIFPNRHNVYLHSTPAPELFSQARRDFSHGCIRVEKPAELAAWALRNTPGWDLERIRQGMQSGKDNQQVNLAKPIPVLILYGTAIVDEAGSVRFFDDIYGQDKSLEKVLAKGYPFP
jgi:murein L,D-transpeptidase YcbB/YkuD